MEALEAPSTTLFVAYLSGEWVRARRGLSHVIVGRGGQKKMKPVLGSGVHQVIVGVYKATYWFIRVS